MPKRKAAAPLLTILTKEVSIKRRRKREADHLRPHLKKGKGEKGKSQKNSQSSRPDTSPPPKSEKGTNPSGKAKKEPCREWKAKGSCRRGEKCPYWHPLTANFKPKGTAERATLANIFT